MIYVFPGYDGRASIVFDATTLSAETKAKGIAIEQLPIPDAKPGKRPILKASKSTGDVWYEYEDEPIPADVEQRVADIELAIAAMIGGAM